VRCRDQTRASCSANTSPPRAGREFSARRVPPRGGRVVAGRTALERSGCAAVQSLNSPCGSRATPSDASSRVAGLKSTRARPARRLGRVARPAALDDPHVAARCRRLRPAAQFCRARSPGARATGRSDGAADPTGEFDRRVRRFVEAGRGCRGAAAVGVAPAFGAVGGGSGLATPRPNGATVGERRELRRRRRLRASAGNSRGSTRAWAILSVIGVATSRYCGQPTCSRVVRKSIAARTQQASTTMCSGRRARGGGGCEGRDHGVGRGLVGDAIRVCRSVWILVARGPRLGRSPAPVLT